MSVQFLHPESKWYFVMWIFIVVVGWILWFFALDHILETGGYAFTVLFGLGIGVISRLSPVRAFQACFLGLLVIALLLAPFGILFGLIIFAVLTALFALAGATIRSIVLRQKMDIHLKPWQWVLLIGGLTLYGDFTALGAFQESHMYSHLEYAIQFYVPALVGLFATGLFTGTFSRAEYGKLMKSVVKVLIVSHSTFLIYIAALFVIAGEIMWRELLSLFLMGPLFAVVLIGTRIGYRFRGSNLIESDIA